MNMSRSGLELLKKSEGFRDRTYQDVAGFQTIGFGHRLLPDENYPGGISLALGEAILAKDVQNAKLPSSVWSRFLLRRDSSTLWWTSSSIWERAALPDRRFSSI